MFYYNFDEVSIGCTPTEEDCAQLGAPDYYERSLIECRAYIRQLERQFELPEELYGEVIFKINSCSHDFGVYRDVVIKYNCDNEKAVEYAFNIEKALPSEWDEEAKAYLQDKQKTA